MKPLLTTLLLLVPFVALAQQGTVLYEETVKFQIDLPPEMKHMEGRFPTENTTSRQLLFDGAVSLMKNAPRAEAPSEIDEEAGGVRIRMMNARADDEVYTDFDAGTRIEKRDFLQRTFLVRGEAPSLAWRLTDERSEFLGHLCQKAVTIRDTIAVEAWFTPEIPAPVGPGPYGGLPGLILVVNEEDGRRTFVAKQISLEPPAEGELTEPTRGREVTRAEFDEIVAEKMKEMGAERGRGGFQIRMRHD